MCMVMILFVYPIFVSFWIARQIYYFNQIVNFMQAALEMYEFLIIILIVQDIAWDWFGKGLAAANLLYFSINLLCFLIPRFLPRAFERYFRERDEIHSKMAEDHKRPIAAAANKKPQTTDKKVDWLCSLMWSGWLQLLLTVYNALIHA